MSNVSSFVGQVIDSFVGNQDTFDNTDNKRPKMTVGLVVAMVLYLLLVLFVGKSLWDNVMCKVVDVCKPMPSLLHFLGLVLLIDLLMPKRI